MGAGLCAGEGERAYTAYAPHYNIFASRTNVFSFSEDVSATKTFRRHFVAETSAAILSPKRPESYSHASMWPLGEGGDAIELYNKFANLFELCSTTSSSKAIKYFLKIDIKSLLLVLISNMKFTETSET